MPRNLDYEEEALGRAREEEKEAEAYYAYHDRQEARRQHNRALGWLDPDYDPDYDPDEHYTNKDSWVGD
jgi:hypothetical protein